MTSYLTLDETASVARCSSPTVRRAAKAGLLESSRGVGANGGKFLFTAEAVASWIRAGCPSRPTNPEPVPVSAGVRAA